MSSKGDEIIRRALESDSLPSLSPIAVQLLQQASDENTSIAQLAQTIQSDPGLTTRLLRMVNSVAYRRNGHEVRSVDRAVVLLGLAEIRVMALSFSIKDAVATQGAEHDYHLFWRTSVHRAILARQCARKLGLPTPEEAFAAGLIMEIGLPLLLRVLTPEEARGFPGMHMALQDQVVWEQQALGLDHRQLGRAVFEAWALPNQLVECQRILPAFYDGPAAPLVLLCDFARRSAESFYATDADLDQIHRVAELRFGWPSEQVNQLIFESLNLAGDSAAALDVEMDHEAELRKALDRARGTIVALREKLGNELRASNDHHHRHTILGAFRKPLLGLAGLVRKLAGGGDNQAALEAKQEVELLERLLDQIETVLEKHG